MAPFPSAVVYAVRQGCRTDGLSRAAPGAACSSGHCCSTGLRCGNCFWEMVSADPTCGILLSPTFLLFIFCGLQCLSRKVLVTPLLSFFFFFFFFLSFTDLFLILPILWHVRS